jgi:glycosyltransferase involved in cell wall biosynthesis
MNIKMGCPKITIITVVRNGEKTLEQTMLSVLRQTYGNIEYIVIDGASTDGTLDIIKSYDEQVKSGAFPNVTFRWMSEPDSGLYDAMNKGIDMATGEWILFLGADDLLLEMNRYIHRLVDVNSVYYGWVIVLPTNKRYGRKYSKYTLSVKNIPHQAIFYPSEILKRRKYITYYSVLSDYELNIYLFQKKVKFVYVDVAIAYFSLGGYSTLIRDFNFEQNFGKLVMSLGTFPYVYSFIRRHISNLIAKK